jgi:hypothetical protein
MLHRQFARTSENKLKIDGLLVARILSARF